MNNPQPPFNWQTFLLGFAIALWIAIVVLFVLPSEDEPAPVVHCSSGTCGGSLRPLFSRRGPLWIPEGGDSYYCTNRQDGGGYVEDAGGGPVQDAGGYVEDAGGYVEDAGGYVEDAGGYVEDTAPRSPAPSDDHDGIVREEWQYHCETNNDGGGYVEDKTGRDVTLPMRTDGRFVCWKDGLKNAVVLRAEEDGGSTAYYRTQINRHQDLILLGGEDPPPPAELVSLPAQPPELDTYVYCMVSERDKEPVIVDRAGTCLANTGGAGCP